MTKRHIGPKDYYDVNPSSIHASGDVWSELPSFGLLSAPFVTGLVITPACDLSNRKVETITYLPVISVADYFSSPGFLPEILRETERQLSSVGVSQLFEDGQERFTPPTPASLDAASELLKEFAASHKLSRQEEEAVSRANAGLRSLRRCASHATSEQPDLALLFGKNAISSIIARIIRNSYRLDLHFLPFDEQVPEWSGIPAHSVALFRYTLTAPLSLLEDAHDLSLRDWPGVIAAASVIWPAAATFARRPLKRLTLRPRFLGDLLTRYVAMYVRLGSPDFTEDTVNAYRDKIQGP